MQSNTVTQQLELAQYKLKSLLGITLAINANASAQELWQKYKEILCDGLSIGKIAVFTITDSWNKVLSHNISETFGNNVDELSSTLLLFKTPTSITNHEYPLLNGFDLIIPVYHKNRPLAFALLGNNEENTKRFGSAFDHITTLQSLTNIVVVALENKRLYKKSLEQESLKKELEVASKIQAMLIPSDSEFPQNAFIHIASFYQPHSEVGGDYYDFMQLNDNEIGFCIGDVSGKGISAAILMSNFQANLRILFKQNVPLPKLITELNENVNKNAKGDRFVTFFIARYNGKTKTLQYINAGHNPPLLFQKSKSSLTYLTNGCVGLGMLDEIPKITLGEIQIDSEDKLLCYTDGVIEAENSEGKQFGTIPLEGILTTDGNAEDIIHYLRSELDSFLGERPTNDDLSILTVDFL